MSGIGVITNPKAKRNLKRPWIRDMLSRIVGDSGKVYETRSIAELPLVAEDFIEQNLDVLAVNGGDGTTHTAITHFIPVFARLGQPLPMLLSLRGGTMNTISNAIKHKGVSEDILASVVRKLRDGRSLDVIRQPILKINDRYGFMWGYGTVGNFLEAYYKGSTLGPWQAIKVVARALGSALLRTQFAKNLFAPCPSVITCDGKRIEMPDLRVALASSVIEMGLGARLAFWAYKEPGFVHARFTAIKAHQVVWAVPKLFMGKPIDLIMDCLARETVIETTGNPPYTIDGELYRDANRFVVSQGPVLNVIREGNKKPLKGIGLQEGQETPKLPEQAGPSMSLSHKRNIEPQISQIYTD